MPELPSPTDDAQGDMTFEQEPFLKGKEGSAISGDEEYGSINEKTSGGTPEKGTWMARAKRWMQVMGPGIVVMLADTDAGCLVVASQSGARFGYSLLPLQIMLIPVLCAAQELTVRLGIFTRKGHGEMIRDYFGNGWAWLSVSTLVIACCGAIVSEFVGIAGVGRIWGVPDWLSVSLAAVFLMVVAMTGSYRRTEVFAVCLGLFELVFVVTAILAQPDLKEMLKPFSSQPVEDKAYVRLAVANIGAVIMPFMIFYQQSAIVDKKLSPADIHIARADTIIGSFVTQFIMCTVIVTTAAAVWEKEGPRDLTTIEEIADAFSEHLGETTGKVLFSMGLMGGALIGGLVVSLTAAWGLGELMGLRRSLEYKATEAPGFYLSYTLMIGFGAVVAIIYPNPIELEVFVEILNALLLPVVLGFLYVLAHKALPDEHRIKGWYALGVGLLFSLCCGVALYLVVLEIIDMVK